MSIEILSHKDIIQLIIAYTCAGAFVFTAIITCASLVGWIKLSDKAQQTKLFSLLIVELVIISIAFFSGFIHFNLPSTPDNEERFYVELIKYELYEDDSHWRCVSESSIILRETFKTSGVEMVGLKRLILNSNTDTFRTESVKYEDAEGNLVLINCFQRGFSRRNIIVFISDNGKVSNTISYIINTTESPIIKETAPALISR